MWLVALLVNSNTLYEMIIVWRKICIVLLSVNQNDQFTMSLERWGASVGVRDEENKTIYPPAYALLFQLNGLNR